jgi:hypothetical protein
LGRENDCQIKAPPFGSAHMVGFIAFQAPLSIRPRRRFRNKLHFNRQKIRRRSAKNPKFYAPSKDALR